MFTRRNIPQSLIDSVEKVLSEGKLDDLKDKQREQEFSDTEYHLKNTKKKPEEKKTKARVVMGKSDSGAKRKDEDEEEVNEEVESLDEISKSALEKYKNAKDEIGDSKYAKHMTDKQIKQSAHRDAKADVYGGEHSNRVKVAKHDKKANLPEDISPDYSTDMLSGRVPLSGKSNDFKSFKVRLRGQLGMNMKPPVEDESKMSTSARMSILPKGVAAAVGVRPAAVVAKEEIELDEAIEGYHVEKMYKLGDGSVSVRLRHKDGSTAVHTSQKPNNLHKELKDKYGISSRFAEEIELEEGKDPHMDAGVGSTCNFVQNENPTSNPAPKSLNQGHLNKVRKTVKEVTMKALGNVKRSQMTGATPDSSGNAVMGKLANSYEPEGDELNG